jgi:hypothetical protein
MRRPEPEEEVIRRVKWPVVIITVALAVFGDFTENKTLLMLSVFCAGVAVLLFTGEDIFRGQLRGRYNPIDSQENPMIFGLLALIQLGCAAFLIVFPILVICGVVEVSLDDAKSFVRIWERKHRR